MRSHVRGPGVFLHAVVGIPAVVASHILPAYFLVKQYRAHYRNKGIDLAQEKGILPMSAYDQYQLGQPFSTDLIVIACSMLFSAYLLFDSCKKKKVTDVPALNEDAGNEAGSKKAPEYYADFKGAVFGLVAIYSFLSMLMLVTAGMIDFANFKDYQLAEGYEGCNLKNQCDKESSTMSFVSYWPALSAVPIIGSLAPFAAVYSIWGLYAAACFIAQRAADFCKGGTRAESTRLLEQGIETGAFRPGR